MTELEAIEVRHSVRAYKEIALSESIVNELNNEINSCNKKSGLNIQLVTNEPKAFKSFMAHYSKFSGVTNYVALIGSDNENSEKLAGYYGEKVVLKAQQLGLNTCWVALTVSKSHVKKVCNINKNEKLICVIAIGYGLTNGVKHIGKEFNQVAECEDNAPEWFIKGVKLAMLAPTAMNQQKFKLVLSKNQVLLKNSAKICKNLDFGIIKYHFEIGAGIENFNWN